MAAVSAVNARSDILQNSTLVAQIRDSGSYSTAEILKASDALVSSRRCDTAEINAVGLDAVALIADQRSSTAQTIAPMVCCPPRG